MKPSNVLLDEHGHVYLADFGLSRYLGDAAASLGPGRSLGTADYVAPEQIRCEEVDGRTDVYALGCLLYESLAGEPPFRRGSDAATLFAQLEDAPPTLPGLEEVLPKALAKDPDDRYPTCGELVADARHALGITEPKRNPWPIAAAAVGIALIAAALGGFFLTRGDGGVPPAPRRRLARPHRPEDERRHRRDSRRPEASAIAVGRRDVWVTSFADGDVWRDRPEDEATCSRLSTGGSPTDIADARGRVLVANGPQHSLTFIDETTGRETHAQSHAAAAAGNGSAPSPPARVWSGSRIRRPTWSAGSDGGRTASRIPDPDPAGQAECSAPTSRSTASRVGRGSGSRASVGRTVWRDRSRTTTRRRQGSAAVRAGSIAAGEGAVWVTSLLDDTVARIDPATNRIRPRSMSVAGVRRRRRGRRGLGRELARRHGVPHRPEDESRVVATIPVGRQPGRTSPSATARSGYAAAIRTGREPTATIDVGVLADCEGNYRLAQRRPRSPGPSSRCSSAAASAAGLRRPTASRASSVAGTRSSSSSAAPTRRPPRRSRRRGGSSTRSASTSSSARSGATRASRSRTSHDGGRASHSSTDGVGPTQLRPGPELLQLPHRRRTAGRPGSARTRTGRSAGATPSLVADSRTTSSTGRRWPASSPSSARSAGRSTSASGCPPGTQDYSPRSSVVPRAGVDGFFFAGYPSDDPGVRERLSAASRQHLAEGDAQHFLRRWDRRSTSSPAVRGPRRRSAGHRPAMRRGDGYMREFRAAFPKLARSMRHLLRHLLPRCAWPRPSRRSTAVDGDLSDGEQPIPGGARERRARLAARADQARRATARRSDSNYLLRYERPHGIRGRSSRSIPSVEQTLRRLLHDERPTAEAAHRRPA